MDDTYRMTERKELEQAMAALEAQRFVLGDAIVEAGLAPMREKLAALNAPAVVPAPDSGDRGEEAERKLVTVMFADISGFTALSEKLDPESVRDLMNQCFTYLVPCVLRYEGTIDKFIGDEIMALFGAPLSHENDAERAVRAALEMMAALERFNTRHGTQLGLHFGINTGLVLAGEIGAGARQDYSVMGDAVNLAARLEDASERGQILAGPDTYRLTAPLFEFDALEPIRVKGKTDPVRVYRALGLKVKPGTVRGLAMKGISSPLVGREQELATVQACIQRLLGGQGGIIGIIGEAGLGKSRLLANAKPPMHSSAIAHTSASGEQVLWLEGQTLSFGHSISYWPFQQILRGWAGISEEDDADATWSKLERHVRDLFGKETIDYLPYLASLLSVEVRGEYAERVKYLDGDAMGKQIFLTARRFFERLARSQPTVLIFEDLHWMDASSIALLEHLLPLVETVPLLIVGLSRPEPDSPAARLRELCAREYADHYREIRLAPLLEVDSAKLIRNLLDIENMPARLRELIVEKAEGNPFFLEEVIRSLIDSGAVIRDVSSGRWRATTQIESLHIPDTIQGVIMARVDRLDEEVKQVLRMASVIGRSFLYRVLKVISETSKRLDDSLVELQQIELIREKQAGPELEYMFKHALAQEATYESVLLQKRRELHARVAQAIESLFAERLEEFYGFLAYHYATAEVWDKAQEYVLKAGDQAGRIAADGEALGHYQQAMAAYARAFGDHWDPLERVQLDRKMGEALSRLGEHRQAVIYLLRALSHLHAPLPSSAWGVRAAILGEVATQLSHVLFPGRFTKAGRHQISPHFEEQSRVYEVIAYIDVLTNPERFLLVALKYLNVSENIGFMHGVSNGFAGIGLICDFVALYPLADFYHRKSTTLSESMQDPVAIAMSQEGLACHTLFIGELDKSASSSELAALKNREIGDLHRWGLSVFHHVVAHIYRGNLLQALDLSRNLVRVGRDGADPQMECWGLSALGFAEQRLGQFAEAIASLQQAAELAKALPDTAFTIQTTADLGRCYLRQGDLTESLATLDASQRAFVPNLGADSYASLRNGSSEAYLLAAERSVALERSNWLKKADRACRQALKQDKEFRPAFPEALRLQGTYEWLRGNPKAGPHWWESSLAEAQTMGMRYDAGMTHLEIGSRLGDRTQLEKAETIFADIGAKFDLERTRNLLQEHTEVL